MGFHTHPCTHLNYMKPVTGLQNFLHSYGARWDLLYASLPPPLHELSLIHLVLPCQEGTWGPGKGSQEDSNPEERRAPRSHGIYHQAQKLIALDVGSFLIEGLEDQDLLWA